MIFGASDFPFHFHVELVCWATQQHVSTDTLSRRNKCSWTRTSCNGLELGEALYIVCHCHDVTLSTTNSSLHWEKGRTISLTSLTYLHLPVYPVCMWLNSWIPFSWDKKWETELVLQLVVLSPGKTERPLRLGKLNEPKKIVRIWTCETVSLFPLPKHIFSPQLSFLYKRANLKPEAGLTVCWKMEFERSTPSSGQKNICCSFNWLGLCKTQLCWI